MIPCITITAPEYDPLGGIRLWPSSQFNIPRARRQTVVRTIDTAGSYVQDNGFFWPDQSVTVDIKTPLQADVSRLQGLMQAYPYLHVAMDDNGIERSFETTLELRQYTGRWSLKIQFLAALSEG